MYSLEWISHTKVQSRIPPLEVVNPSLTCWVVRVVELNTPIKTQNNKFDINSESKTAVKSQLFVESIPFVIIICVKLQQISLFNKLIK